MPFFGRNSRPGMFPPNGQQFGPQPQIGRQQMGMPRPNEFARPREAFYPPYPVNARQGQQQFNPYPQQQQQGSRFSGLSDNLNTVMGHVGTLTNGINTMRQVGAMLNLFK